MAAFWLSQILVFHQKNKKSNFAQWKACLESDVVIQRASGLREWKAHLLPRENLVTTLFFIFSLCRGGFSDIPSSYEYKRPPSQVQKERKTLKPVKKKSIDQNLEKLMLQDEKIMDLLKKQEKTLIVRRKREKVLSLSRFKGTLLNSVLATNIKPSKFIVKTEIEGRDEAEIRCMGHSFDRRVLGHCDLLVSDGKEYFVDVDIWGLDGAEGIIADYHYSGEEKAFLTGSLSVFLEGVLEASKDRVMTPYGQISKGQAKNNILNGFASMAQNARSKIKTSGEQTLSILFINAGKDVLVFFNKTLDFSKENP